MVGGVWEARAAGGGSPLSWGPRPIPLSPAEILALLAAGLAGEVMLALLGPEPTAAGIPRQLPEPLHPRDSVQAPVPRLPGFHPLQPPASLLQLSSLVSLWGETGRVQGRCLSHTVEQRPPRNTCVLTPRGEGPPAPSRSPRRGDETRSPLAWLPVPSPVCSPDHPTPNFTGMQLNRCGLNVRFPKIQLLANLTPREMV